MKLGVLNSTKLRANPKIGREVECGWSSDFLDELVVQLIAQQAIGKITAT